MNPHLHAKPCFSIIIPTLNEEQCLPLLLSDIEKQTFKDCEVLVIDGSSQDNTVSLAQAFSTVSLYVSPEANVAKQRNLGAQYAHGKYLLFIDADTRLPHYFLEGLKYHLTVSRPDVFTCWMMEASNHPQDKAIIAFINFYTETSKWSASPSCYASMMGCKQQIFRKLQGFNTTMTFGEDAELVRRALKAGYHFELFRDPRFVHSLRRYHKEGTIKVLQKTALLNLNIFFNNAQANSHKDYPMLGGSYYKNIPADSPNMFKEMADTIKKIQPQHLQKILKNIFFEE